MTHDAGDTTPLKAASVLTQEQAKLLMTAKLLMLRRMPYYGVYSIGLTYTIDPTMPSAATDGRNIRYNPTWLLGGAEDKPLRALEEVVFIIAHEILHCSFKHMIRMGWRDHGLWNVACDYAINLILHNGKVGKFPTLEPDPKTGKPAVKLLDKAYDGLSAETIYDLLEKQCKKGGGKGDGKGGKGSLSVNGVVIDLSNPDPGGTGGFEMPINVDGSKLTDAQRSELERVIDGNTSTAAMSAKSQGLLPADLERLITTALKPKINWKDILRQFVARTFPADYSWHRPHRRFIAMPLIDEDEGLYLPHIEKSGVGRILVIMDTSGSIDFSGDKSEGAQFFSEIKGIFEDCNPEALEVIYCDAAVAGHDTFQQGEEPTLKPRGGGGTDFRPPFKYIDKHNLDIQCAIYLTDGYGNFPDKPMTYPVLWVIDTDVVAPWGATVKLER